jgi:hypothetical protein
MGKAVLDVSLSLDGFITGPNVSREQPLGEGGERLHDWMRDVKQESFLCDMIWGRKIQVTRYF